MNRGRIQAQGGGVEKSATWATDSDVTKSIGIERVNNLESQLTPAERNVRTVAIQKSKVRINSASPNGVSALMKKSYFDDKRDKKVRVDIEVNAGIAFIDDPNT